MPPNACNEATDRATIGGTLGVIDPVELVDMSPQLLERRREGCLLSQRNGAWLKRSFLSCVAALCSQGTQLDWKNPVWWSYAFIH